MMNIVFKQWLEGIEEYEPWKKRISQYQNSRNFVFDSWFPQERIYIPFNHEYKDFEMEKFKNEIQYFLKDYGYELVDLKSGYAKKIGSQNLVRIVKLLENIKYKDLKDLENQFKSGQISEIKYKEEKLSITKYYEDMKSEFQNLNGRTSGEFQVVISKNIHDIASMSTGRGWTSCMELGKGSHHKDVFCEIENGGFVAYLIRTNDPDIKRPIARIHIRRFDNKLGKSIAVPEESIYGQEIPEFMNIVKQWIDSKQGNITAGKYRRSGGEYSDTFGGERKTIFPPQDIKTTVRWLTKWLQKDEKERKKYSQYFLKAIQFFFQSNEPFPDSFVKKLKKFIFESNSTFPTENWNQSTTQFQAAFALKYPKLITKKDFESAFNYVSNNQITLIDKLVETFPQFVTKELFDSIKNNRSKSLISKLKPDFGLFLDDEIKTNAMKNLDINNPEFTNDYSDGYNKNNSIYGVLGNIHDEIVKLERLKPIPESIIRKLVDFANKRNELKLVDKNPKDIESVKGQVLDSVIHVLGVTESDTPTVQRFYQSLLPQWNKIGGIGILGWAILKLKENGSQFLPFIKKKYEELSKYDINKLNSWQKNQIEKCLESYRYAIDGLTNGTGRSNKYIFYYGNRIEKEL